MKSKFFLCLVVVVFCLPATRSLAAEVSEGGVTIRVGRIVNGDKSGRHFYGYSGVEFVFPQTGGGTLSFLLWNDQQRVRPSTTNYLNFILADQKYILQTYSTPLDLKEFFVENPGDWGPGGGSQVRIAIPPGLQSLPVAYDGSETGIEISDVRFSPGGSLSRPVEYEQAVNTTSECFMAFGRTQHGAQSNKIFYGYSGGEIALPNRRGGVLAFRYWNDQQRVRPATTNRLDVQLGEKLYIFEQYTTPLDLKDYFSESPNDWGPAGGSVIRVEVPAGLARVALSYSGSETGIEITEAQFSTGAKLGSDYVYDEHVNWTERTYNAFGRINTGGQSRKQFYGYSGGTIALPHRKGGRLRFATWNDQNRSNAGTRNFIRYNYGNVRESVSLKTTNADLREFFVENPNEWGPAGGRTVELDIPPGVSHVDIGYENSETGIEISDTQFLSQPGPSVATGPCLTGRAPVVAEQVSSPPPPTPTSIPASEITPSRMGTPEIAVVDPPRVARGSESNLRITGRYFAPGARLDFYCGGVQALQTSVLSASEIQARIQVSSSTNLGSCNLIVANPNGRRGFINFEVTDQPPVKSVAEIQPSEVATPEVSAVDVPTVTRGSQANLRVTGRNFAPGAHVDCPCPGIRVLSVDIRGPDELIIQLVAAPDAAPAGFCYLAIVNPNQRRASVSLGVANAGPTTIPTALVAGGGGGGRGPCSAKFRLIRMGGKVAFLNLNKTEGTLNVSDGAMSFVENEREVFSARAADVREIGMETLLGIPTAAFHIILSSGQTFAFVVPSMRPADAQTIVDSTQRTLQCATTGSARGSSWTGGGRGCSDPQTLPTMDDWLARAVPLQQSGESLRYESWGRVVGRSSSAALTTAGKPDTPLSRCEWLWQLAPQLSSSNLGTLKEFVQQRLP